MAELPGVAASDAPQLNTSETSAGEDTVVVVQPPQLIMYSLVSVVGEAIALARAILLFK